MAIGRIGRYVTGPEVDRGEVGSGWQRACVYDSSTQQLIVYELGAWIGTLSGSPRVRLVIGDVNGSGTGVPGDVLAYTSELTPAAGYSDIAGGDDYFGSVSPFLANPAKYSLGVTVRNGTISHSMRAAAAIGAANRNFYDKSGLGSTVPTDPLGGSGTYNGHMSIWATGEVNEPPDTPTGLTLSGLQTDANLKPAIKSDFSDVNEVLPNGAAWDYINQVHIQVKPSGGSVIWDYVYTASEGEREARVSSRTYTGPALSYGTPYEYRIRHSDRAGAWSSFTGWTSFSVAGAGSVEAPSSPTGKQTTLTPGPFTAKWTSQASLSTNAVQARLKIGGVVVQTGSIAAKTYASGANIQISWAESGFSTLDWGTDYTFEIRARDTANQWSDWSGGRAFQTNTAPAIPVLSSPVNSAVVTARPLLIAKAGDHEGDPLTVKFRIKDSSGNVLFTRTGTYRPATSDYSYQTTSTDLAALGTFRWDVYSFDGTLYSGETTVEASAAKTAERSFVYASGPSVTLNSPADGTVLTTNTLSLAWTAPTQVSRQITVYSTSGSLVYQTDNEVTTAQAATINPSVLNGSSYTVTVKVTDSNGLTGESTPVVFTVQYPEPDPLPLFEAYPTSIGTDTEASVIFMTWQPTSYSASQFLGYDIHRVPLTGGIVTGPREWLRRIKSPLQTVFIDAEGVSGQDYRYELRQAIQVGQDELVSSVLTAQARADFRGIIIHNVFEPEEYRINLQYAASAGDEGDWQFEQDVAYVLPTGAKQSRAVRGTRNQWNPSGSFRLITDQTATARQRRDQFKKLVEHGGTLCFRDGHSNLAYVSLRSARMRNRFGYYEVDLSFENVAYKPGEQS